VAREGLFAGGSSGTAICAALQVARELDDPDALVVTLLPDGGRPYLSKVFNDHWMREHGYMAGGGRTAGDLLGAKAADGALLTVSSRDEVGRALALMQQHGVSQLPVVSAEDKSVFVGVVSDRGLLWASAEHPGILKQEVTEVLEPPLPELAPEDPAEDAIRLLEEGRQAGKPLGILTALDLIEVLNR
jgi:cystathionine beta-synthase